jgi:hypothetical protein
VQQAIEQFGNLTTTAPRSSSSKVPDAVVPIDFPGHLRAAPDLVLRAHGSEGKLYLIFYALRHASIQMWLPIDGRGVLLVGVGSSPGMAMGARPVDITRCYSGGPSNRRSSTRRRPWGRAFSMEGASKLFRRPRSETEGVEQISR